MTKRVVVKLQRNAKDSAKDCLPKNPDASSWSSPLPSPLKLFLHQQEAIKFALKRKASYLALDPGLGKTIIAAKIAEATQARFPDTVVYICPPFLVRNVQEEFNRWAEVNVWVIPDTRLSKESIDSHFLLIIDEAHRFKNPKAKRTKDLLKLLPKFVNVVYLSGTPMPNRPMELYTILKASAPECIGHMNQWDFGRRYCNGKKGYWGWDFSGASNMDELAKRLKPFMLRMRKEDVLDLPPKIEETFVLNNRMTKKLATAEKGITKRFKSVDALLKRRIAALDEDGELAVASYRRLLGLEKVKQAVEYVKSILEESDESILLFAYHKEVIEKLTAELAEYVPFVITGDVSHKERHAQVKEFQKLKGEDCRLFIANFQTMVGFTLTKATRVIFVEFGWVPGENEQAMDRAHRIGQENSIFVQYLAFKDSLDIRILNTLRKKASAISQL